MKCLFKTLFALALALAYSRPPGAAVAAVQKRGLFFYRHLVETFPNAPHRIEIVPGVDHNAFPLYSSPQGRNAIFF